MAPSLGRYVRNCALLWGLAILVAVSGLHPALAAPYAAYVMDARTGETLYSQNADTSLHPASLTKMMTLYITFQEIERGKISLDTIVTVSKNAASQPPSRLGLRPGQKIAVRYLIRAAAVKSANDAASALGDFIGGNEANFAARMTKTARALGMKNSTFKNANGLTTPGHLSSAHDMSILGRRLFYDFPQYYNVFSRRTVDAGIAQVNSTNRRFLDAYKGADGIKTGYTVAAGFNLVASAERGNKRIIATVFGGSSTAQRNQKIAELLDMGFGKAPERTKINPAPVLAMRGNDLMADPTPEAVRKAVEADRAASSASSSLESSQRPQSRPNAQKAAAAALAVAAMQDDIAGALAEAIAPAAEAATPVAPPPPGTLDAQVADLARGASQAGSEEPDDEAPPVVAGKVQLAANQTGAGMKSSIRPAARPARQAQPAPAPAPAPVIALAAKATAPAPAPTPAPQPAKSAPLQPDAGTVVALSAPATAAAPPSPFATASAQTEALASGEPVQLASNTPARNAPIFDSAATSDSARAAEAEVVTRISTSGGRHYGINVGRFNTRTGAESALTKTLLAESATLKGALRKVVAGSRGFEANFMGLSQDQADLACARLQARAIQCFAIGE